MCLKHTVGYYTDRKTPIYACFLDLSKAFDRVNYNMLWKKMEEAGIPNDCTDLLKFWYQNQTNQVRWAKSLSSEYRLECGVRQGGLTSPKLFNLYMNDLIGELSSMHAGCYIENTCVNNISYADDMVLLSPSIGALRQLVAKCEKYAAAHGLVYNAAKSEVMVFKAGKIKPYFVPPVSLGEVVLRVVDRFKYLGHIITNDLCDDSDIERERRALSVRSNMLARRFARCSVEVKITLFKAYSQSFYSSALRIQYNNAFRMLLRLPKWCSASGMLAQAHTDDFHAIMRKKITSLMGRVRESRNSILKVIADRFSCPIMWHWMEQVRSTLTYVK